MVLQANAALLYRQAATQTKCPRPSSTGLSPHHASTQGAAKLLSKSVWSDAQHVRDSATCHVVNNLPAYFLEQLRLARTAGCP